MRQERLKLNRRYLELYDPNNQQILYKPKITKEIPEAVLNTVSPTLKAEEFFVKEGKEFYKKCKEIFNFLDKEEDGFVFMEKINLKKIHKSFLPMLTPIYCEIIRVGEPLDFCKFYKMIIDEKLGEYVEEMFLAFDVNLNRWRSKSSNTRKPFR